MATLKKQPLEVTVMNASKEQAEKVTRELLAMKTTSGKCPFKQEFTETGWKVRFPMETADGTLKNCTCFEYRKTEPGQQVFYDPRIVTIQ